MIAFSLALAFFKLLAPLLFLFAAITFVIILPCSDSVLSSSCLLLYFFVSFSISSFFFLFSLALAFADSIPDSTLRCNLLHRFVHSHAGVGLLTYTWPMTRRGTRPNNIDTKGGSVYRADGEVLKTRVGCQHQSNGSARCVCFHGTLFFTYSPQLSSNSKTTCM